MKLLRQATFLFGMLVLVCLTFVLEPVNSSEKTLQLSPQEQKPLNASMAEGQTTLIKKIVATGKKQLATKPAYYDLVGKPEELETINKASEVEED